MTLLTKVGKVRDFTHKGREAGPVPEAHEKDGNAEGDEEENDGHEEDVGHVGVGALPQTAQHLGALLLRGVGEAGAVDDDRAKRGGAHARSHRRHRQGGALRDVGHAHAVGEEHLQSTSKVRISYGKGAGGDGKAR